MFVRTRRLRSYATNLRFEEFLFRAKGCAKSGLNVCVFWLAHKQQSLFCVVCSLPIWENVQFLRCA